MINRVNEWLGKLLAEHPAFEAVLWFLGAAACVILLAWFLLLSGYGAPPEFIYDQF